MSAVALTVTTRRLYRYLRVQVEAIWLVCLCISLVIRTAESANQHGTIDIEDNEFAEFEEMDEEMNGPSIADEEKRDQNDMEGGGKDIDEMLDRGSSFEEDEQDDAVVQDDVDEFAHLQDEEEFENFDNDRVGAIDQDRRSDQPQPLKFTDVPAHFRSNWTNYQVEMLVLAGMTIYLLNYIYGRMRNQTLAYAWFAAHKDLLEHQFANVGDDGSSSEPSEIAHLIKETDSAFSIWCSGRVGCQSMIVQLKLIKRQDLVSVISQMVRPKFDRVIVRVDLDQNEMDTFVVAFGQKKRVVKLVKDMNDLSIFTTERKSTDRLGLPSSFAVFSEIAEATVSVLDPRVIQTMTKHEQSIDYLHFSDQFTGAKPQDGETQSRLPEISKVLIFSFNIPGKLNASEIDVENILPLLNLVFYCLDKVRRYRISKEGKQKADKNRQSAQEAFLKTTHQQRQEAAQARREEKARERKQKVMDEEDPEKQRRLEKQEQKREYKMKQPKMKQLKMKQ